MALGNAVSEGKSWILSRERNDSVQNVMTDVRASAVAYAGSLAPFLDDRDLVAPEIGVVEGYVADPSEP